MKYIDEARIQHLLEMQTDVSVPEFEAILAKATSLQRLSLEETAALICVDNPQRIERLLQTAAKVKNDIYGTRVVLFAPLYVSNLCANQCTYCAFSTSNKDARRKHLSIEDIRLETRELLRQGHKRVLMVAGEVPTHNEVQYYVDAIAAMYEERFERSRIKRININCAPLPVDSYKKLKAAGIGTYQLFQETYHEATYHDVHISGPKTDPDNRISAIDRAFEAGIDDVGLGVLYGLYDYRFETLGLMMHIEALERQWNVGPHTISVPRIEPAEGSSFSNHPPHQLTDLQFKKVVAVLRLAVPYTGIILSTRESPELRDELFALGISQVSAGSCTSPGGYSELPKLSGQFEMGDHRSLHEVIASLIDKNIMPSFCAACYRSHRTGESFMNLAKPGTIKGKCNINALITLKEYLDDYASPTIRKKGYALIDREREKLDESSKMQLSRFFEEIDKGLRDKFV